MVVVECFDLKFDGGLYGSLAVVAVAHSGANGGYGGQPPLASQNQIKPTKKKKKFETHKALPPTPPPPLLEPTTQHHHHAHNPQPPQATTHNPTIIKSLSNPQPKSKKRKQKKKTTAGRDGGRDRALFSLNHRRPSSWIYSKPPRQRLRPR